MVVLPRRRTDARADAREPLLLEEAVECQLRWLDVRATPHLVAELGERALGFLARFEATARLLSALSRRDRVRVRSRSTNTRRACGSDPSQRAQRNSVSNPLAMVFWAVRAVPPSPSSPTKVLVRELCERGDSNSHLFRDRDLNPARLPIPPRSRPVIFAHGASLLLWIRAATPTAGTIVICVR